MIERYSLSLAQLTPSRVACDKFLKIIFSNCANLFSRSLFFCIKRKYSYRSMPLKGASSVTLSRRMKTTITQTRVIFLTIPNWNVCYREILLYHDDDFFPFLFFLIIRTHVVIALTRLVDNMMELSFVIEQVFFSSVPFHTNSIKNHDF